MDLMKIRSVTDKNIERIKSENLYRGIKYGHKIRIQCMDKDFEIVFDFKQETTTIENRLCVRVIPFEFMAPKLRFSELLAFC